MFLNENLHICLRTGPEVTVLRSEASLRRSRRASRRNQVQAGPTIATDMEDAGFVFVCHVLGHYFCRLVVSQPTSFLRPTCNVLPIFGTYLRELSSWCNRLQYIYIHEAAMMHRQKWNRRRRISSTVGRTATQFRPLN